MKVAWRPGNDWAQGMRLTWVTVGAAPGLCPAEQGFLALVSDTADRSNLLALAPWEGSCVTEEHSVRFMTAAGQHLILEADGDAGEDFFTERWDRVWLLAQTRLQAGRKIQESDRRHSSTMDGSGIQAQHDGQSRGKFSGPRRARALALHSTLANSNSI